jgi:hypothetical protein
VVLSDFQQVDWGQGVQLARIQQLLAKRGWSLCLVPCRAGSLLPNLAILELECVESALAANVPAKVRLRLGNFGPQPARQVAVALSLDQQPLPAAIVGEIRPWSSVVQELYVLPPKSGQLRLTARLAADALIADNDRHFVLPVMETIRTLLVDGDPQAADALYVEAALEPGGAVSTGFSCRRIWAGSLGDARLEDNELIILLNCGRLPPPVVDQIEQYVRQGGGLLYFVGEKDDSQSFAEQFFGDGRGILPVRIQPPRRVPPNLIFVAGSLRFVDHPALPGLRALEGPILSSISVSQHCPIELVEDLKGSPDGSIFLRLADGSPLGVLFTVDKGRTAIIGTTAGPRWNNWARVSPSFVVLMLELAGYLSRKSRRIPAVVVGSSPTIELAAEEGAISLRYRLPGRELDAEVPAEKLSETAVQLPAPMLPGFGEIEWERPEREKTTRYFAVNVDCRESDLRIIPVERVRSELGGVAVEVVRPEELPAWAIRPEAPEVTLMGPALVLLVITAERLLAFWAASGVLSQRKSTRP